MKRLLTAYGFLNLVAVALAFLVWVVWSHYDAGASFGLVLVFLLLFVHVRALSMADEHFRKKLGVWKPQISAIGAGRSIPVNVFESAIAVLPGVGVQRPKSISLDDGPTSYVVGDVVLPAETVKYFVRRAFMRQRSGRAGLARSYWLKSHRPVWERSEYEAVISLLVDAGVIIGRRAGKAGRLVGGPAIIQAELQRRFSG